jgi:uncharacterized protein YchJ
VTSQLLIGPVLRRVDGDRATLRERSSFVRHDGRWVYLDGDQLT